MKTKLWFFILSGWLVSCTISHTTPNLSLDKQIEATRMAQKGIYYYWNGGDLEKVEKEFFKGITLKGNLEAVAYFFEQAIALDPHHLAYRFSLASTKVIEGKVNEALAIYREIQALVGKNFEAALLEAVYSCYSNPTAVLSAVESLATFYPEQTALYFTKIQRSQSLMNQPIQLQAEKVIPKISGRHAIVVLGYALANDGSMRLPLIGRLNQALALHQLTPNSPIVVTGGVSKAGVTESYLMSQWLKEHGIPASLIYLEDKATDTVGNALFSVAILEKLELESITIVSSASHVRRGMVSFAEAADQRNLSWQISNLAFMDFDTPEDLTRLSSKENLVIMRDLLRTSGIAAYPGIQD